METRFPLDSRTLVAIWAAGWSAALLIIGGDVWMQHVVRGVPLFSERSGALRSLVGVLIGAALSPGVFLALRHFTDRERPLALRILHHIPIGVVYWLVWSTTATALQLLLWPGRGSTPAAALGMNLTALAFNALLIFAVIALLFEAILTMARASREETRASNYAAEVSRARSAALAAQLDPHFLFNTLHVASGLMRRDVEAARGVIGDLTGLLEESFQREGRRMVRLGDEIRLVERYLRIQRARFGNRLIIEYEVDPRAADVPIPPLLLQPLVENALQHGIARNPGEGVIRIDVRRDPGAVTILVENTGPPRIADHSPGIRERIGLGGVRARLHSLFGASARLEVRHDPSGTFRAEVTVPSLGMSPGMEREGPADRPPSASSDRDRTRDAVDGGRAWGWGRWMGVGALAWLGVTAHFLFALGLRRMVSGRPFYSSWEELAPNALMFFIGALLTVPVVLVLRRIRPRLRGVPALLGLHLGTGLAFWAVWAILSWLAFPVVLGRTVALDQLLAASAFIHLTLYTGLALVVEATWQLGRARRMALEAAALRADVLAAETAALQSKVSPRLLFDSLALVSELMQDDVRAARTVLADLGELLRVSLGRTGNPFVSVKEELDHVRKVLDLHIGRGNGRAHLEVDLVDGAGARMVPRLLLQPWAAELARRAAGACRRSPRILIRGEPAGTDRLTLSALVDCGGDPAIPVDVPLPGPDLDRIRRWLATAYGGDPGVRTARTSDGSYTLEFTAPPPDALPERLAAPAP